MDRGIAWLEIILLRANFDAIHKSPFWHVNMTVMTEAVGDQLPPASDITDLGTGTCLSACLRSASAAPLGCASSLLVHHHC